MRSKIAVGILLATVILCPGHFGAYGQDDRGSITFGSVRLVLGMPQQAAIANLTPEYDVVDLVRWQWISLGNPGQTWTTH